MKVLRAVIILIVGVLAGVFLTRYLPQDRTPQTTPPAESESAPTIVNGRSLAAPALTLIGRAPGKLQSTSLAIAVGEPDIVIASIQDFVGAAKLLVKTSNGRVVPIESVVATDEFYGIAALRTATALESVEILQSDPGTGNLYMGRSVSLLGLDGNYRAQVNSAANQGRLGTYYYTLQTSRLTRNEAAAVIDPQSRTLLGYAVAGEHSTYSASAFDNEPVSKLMARIGLEPERTLDDYANFYFSQTTTGRLALLERLVASEQLDSAIHFGTSILFLDSYTQDNARPLMREAYVRATRLEIGKSEWRRAIGLVSAAERTVGLDEELRLMRVEAYQAVGELERALNDLLALDDPSAHRVRVMVIEAALATGQDDRSGRSLLERALASDPDFAPYHRLLGEALARQGDINGALAALERALALDPTMATELEPLLQRFRARRDTPVLAEVPIQRDRGTLYVNVRINGSNETFRFLFDTGASYTAITSETALRMGINNIFFGAPVVQLETANGRVYTTTATLDSIDVGGARVNNVEAVVLESMSGVDGLLGQSFLRHFDIDINRTRGVIAFNRRLGE